MCAFRLAVLAAVVLSLWGCSGGGGPLGGTAGSPVRAGLGEPIEGLPDSQRAAFMRGRELMEKVFRPSEGLGPFYNAASCVACHSTPVTGGSSPAYRNFFLAAQGFPALQGPVSPDLPSIVVPNFRWPPTNPRPSIPPSTPTVPVTSAQRNAPPMFGVGLFEFVSDATIISNADPDDADADGIHGRYNRDADANIGRFGYKAQANNIEVFIRGASNNQMGITTDPVLGNAAVVNLGSASYVQVPGTQNQPITDNDPVSDPEVSSTDFGDLVVFSRFVAPPRPLPFNEAAQRGEQLFATIGCTACHIPELPSALGPLKAYTDLLLHNMGPELADGLAFGQPQASILEQPTTVEEFRTQPLWGVSLHPPFLHDGRADTLEDAILAHGGEGDASRQAFQGLTAAEQADLIAFLESL